MKIALITKFWLESEGGGIREYTKNLVQNLKNRNHDVIVLFKEGADKSNYKLPKNKIKFIMKSRKILKKEKPNIIITIQGSYLQLPALLYKRKQRKCKIFTIFLSAVPRRFPIHKRLFYYHLLNKFNNVGFISKGLKENIIQNLGVNFNVPSFILYPGVTIERPTKEEIEKFITKFNLSIDNKYLLGQGLTALPGKKEGAKLIIQALKKILRTNPNVRLILTREGKYTNELRKYVRSKKMTEYVVFTGDLKNWFIPIEISDIYTHITLEDGLPLSLIVAMYFQKPIVASNLFGIPEAINNGKNGILVNNEVSEISKAIKSLLDDEEFAKSLGKNALNTAKKKFNWKVSTDHLLKIIKDN